MSAKDKATIAHWLVWLGSAAATLVMFVTSIVALFTLGAPLGVLISGVGSLSSVFLANALWALRPWNIIKRDH